MKSNIRKYLVFVDDWENILDWDFKLENCILSILPIHTLFILRLKIFRTELNWSRCHNISAYWYTIPNISFILDDVRAKHIISYRAFKMKSALLSTLSLLLELQTCRIIFRLQKKWKSNNAVSSYVKMYHFINGKSNILIRN